MLSTRRCWKNGLASRRTRPFTVKIGGSPACVTAVQIVGERLAPPTRPCRTSPSTARRITCRADGDSAGAPGRRSPGVVASLRDLEGPPEQAQLRPGHLDGQGGTRRAPAAQAAADITCRWAISATGWRSAPGIPDHHRQVAGQRYLAVAVDGQPRWRRSGSLDCRLERSPCRRRRLERRVGWRGIQWQDRSSRYMIFRRRRPIDADPARHPPRPVSPFGRTPTLFGLEQTEFSGTSACLHWTECPSCRLNACRRQRTTDSVRRVRFSALPHWDES